MESGVLIPPRDHDTTSWSPSLTFSIFLGMRSRDTTGTYFPASNGIEFTAAGGRCPTDSCNTLSNRGGNTHTHYEPTASGRYHDDVRMPQYTGQPHTIPETIHALPPALVLRYRGARNCRHTTPSVSESKAQNHLNSRRPHHYNSGGIYASAYNGIL